MTKYLPVVISKVFPDGNVNNEPLVYSPGEKPHNFIKSIQESSAVIKSILENQSIKLTKNGKIPKRALSKSITVKVETLAEIIELLEQAKKQTDRQETSFQTLLGMAVRVEQAKQRFRQNPEKDWNKKARACLKELGFTSGGKRRPVINKQLLFTEFLLLTYYNNPNSNFVRKELTGVDHQGPLEPWDALDILCKLHGLTSPESTLKAIRQYVTTQKKELNKPTEDRCFAAIFKETNGLKGIIPGNR